MTAVNLNIECVVCSSQNKITVERTDMDKYMSGVLIQDAFPYLSPEQRELLITGICPTCWDRNFKDEDEEPREVLENAPEKGFPLTCIHCGCQVYKDDSVECGKSPHGHHEFENPSKVFEWLK